MEKYIKVEWPESQKFEGRGGSITAFDEDGDVYFIFVPEEFYNKHKEQVTLEEMFDTKKAEVQDERERKHRERLKMDADERKWIEETVKKLEFLRERGFKVETYFGGLYDGWPNNYITITKGRWVQIDGSSARRKDGTLDQTSPYIANYLNPTMEELIKTIAKW